MIAAAIPIFNESSTIREVVTETRKYVDDVLVVDDGSSDGGSSLAREAGAKVIRHDGNLGKGLALQTALRWSRSQRGLRYLVLLDGDGQHAPSDIPHLLEAADMGAFDIVVGSRFLGESNVPLYRLFGLHVLSACASLGSGIHLTDSQSGFRVLSEQAVRVMDLGESTFSVETEMQFVGAASRLRMAEAPISIRYAGPARRSPIVHGVSVLLRTIRMTALKRPFRLPLLMATPFVAVQIARLRGRATEES